MFCLTSCSKTDKEPDQDEPQIFFPRGHEVVIKGNVYGLSWSAPGWEKVDIELFENEYRVYTIRTEIENSGFYNWKVPAASVEGSDYYIKISDSYDTNRFVINSGGFLIRQPGIPSTFTDSRDGRIYKTVVLGDQEWMAENFNFSSDEGAFCYGNNPFNCNDLGKLYTLETAINDCPAGWHLPSDKEWQELEEYVGVPAIELDNSGNRGRFSANLLKKGGGTGFDVTYGGYYNNCLDAFAHIGWEAHYWTSSVSDQNRTLIRVVSIGSGAIARIEVICHKGSSVRYVKDRL